MLPGESRLALCRATFLTSNHPPFPPVVISATIVYLFGSERMPSCQEELADQKGAWIHATSLNVDILCDDIVGEGARSQLPQEGL